jgi:transcriptional regulator with XRE-family HTH domain
MKNRKPSLAIRLRLSDNLKALRKARGYTQAALAQRAGFKETYIGNVEQATVNASLASLEALAQGLGCFEEDLLRRGAP